MTLTLGKKKCREGLNVFMNFEFNLLHHVGVVAKKVRAAAAAAGTAAAAHEGNDNTPSGKKRTDHGNEGTYSDLTPNKTRLSPIIYLI